MKAPLAMSTRKVMKSRCPAASCSGLSGVGVALRYAPKPAARATPPAPSRNAFCIAAAASMPGAKNAA